MMGEAQKARVKKGAAKVRHLDRRKSPILRYYLTKYPLTKLRRIFQTQGPKAARAWAMSHDADIAYAKVLHWWEAKQQKSS